MQNIDTAERKGDDAGKSIWHQTPNCGRPLPSPYHPPAKRGASVQVSEWQPFAVIPKRGVVERSFVWQEKCRRLWKNGER